MKFHIERIFSQDSPEWAVTEFFYWNQDVVDILKRNPSLLNVAYDAVDWEAYYERLKGTPFHDWATEGRGILSFGGTYHLQTNSFFSVIGDIFIVEGDYLREHPEFSQVLHNLHVETAEEMIDFIMQKSKEG